jgi:hypothetical protein
MYLPEPARQRRPRSELEHGLRSCSGGTSTSRHLAERHPQVLIIARTVRPTSVTSSGDCPAREPWLITDLPRCDFFPDRYRPLGDRDHAPSRGRNNDRHGHRRAFTSVRHRRGHPRPQPRPLDPGLPAGRAARRGPVPGHDGRACTGCRVCRAPHRRRRGGPVGHRGHRHLRGAAGPRRGRRRLRGRRSATDERARRPWHRQIRPAGRPPHRRSSPPVAGHSAAPPAGRRRGPGGCPRPARRPRPHEHRAHRHDQRSDRALTRGRPRDRRPTPADRRPDHHGRRLAHARGAPGSLHCPLGSRPAG